MRADFVPFFKKRLGSFPLLLSIILSLGFLVIFYAPMVFHPNQHMFTGSGDGIKNYYTYAYHIEHDSTFRNFEGMNYPYGELHQFTDGQPLLANTVKVLSSIFPKLSNYSIGILNLMMMLSFVFASVLFYLIIREFGVSPLIAALAAFAIMTLSPQIHRWGGHLSLGYFCAFPLAFYFLIKYLNTRKWIWTILLFVLNLALLFTHPYLMVMNAAFLVMVWVWDQILLHKKERLKSFLHVGVQAILPLMFWLIYIKLFDNHHNRPDDMFGIHGIATLSGLFFPPVGDLKNVFQSVSWLNYNSQWESWSYLGIINIIVIFVVFGKLLVSLIRRRKVNVFPEGFPKQLKILWLSSGFVLLYAFGVPYTIGMDFLLDWFPQLQQIRAVARFAWVFYYVTSVVSVMYLICLFQHRKHLLWFAIGFLCVVFIYEGVQYHSTYKKYYLRSANVFNPKTEDAIVKSIIELKQEIDFEAYQAIIPLPYYHLGSGRYQVAVSDNASFAQSMIISYYSGLPLMSVALSRTSLTETRKLLSIFNPPGCEMELIEDISDKPVLLFVGNSSMLKAKEKQLVDASDLLVDKKAFSVYALSLQQYLVFKENKLKSEIEAFSQLETNNEGEFVSSTGDTVLFRGLNDNKPMLELDTSLTFKTPMHGYNKFAEFSGDAFISGEKYEVSFWFYNPENRLYLSMIINQFSLDDTEDWTDYFSMRQGIHIDDWTLVRYQFTPKDSIKKIDFVFHYDPKTDTEIYFNDMLVRRVNSDVYLKMSDNKLFKNNFRYNIDCDIVNDMDSLYSK